MTDDGGVVARDSVCDSARVRQRVRLWEVIHRRPTPIL